MTVPELPDDEELFIRAAMREGLITPAHVEEGRELQTKIRELGLKAKPIGEVLLERGILDEEQRAHLDTLVKRVKEAFRIPGYKLLERLGRGSMGTVYKARQLEMDRTVAIKILARRLSENSAFVSRFRKEARVIGKLNHPHIVQGFAAGESEGTYYFVMEYCPGPTLLEILGRGGALDPDRALGIMIQIARALDHAHEQSLVHRDVKPDNIVLASGVAKLCDLGLAKDVSSSSASTDRGTAVGTPNYISPEQASGREDVDIRADLYSFGATLYHAIAGAPPFDGATPMVIMVKHINEAPIPLGQRVADLDPGFERIAMRCLAKLPDDRYQSPRQLLADLENLRAEREGRPLPFPQAAPKAASTGPAVVRRRRRR